MSGGYRYALGTIMADIIAAIKRELREVQTFAPGLRWLKFSSYNFASRNLGLFVEPEFKLLAALAPINLALDIGGNWGQSVYALRRYARPRHLVTVEPNPVLGQRLSRMFSSDAGVTVKQVGLSDSTGEMMLHVPRYRNFVYDGLASLDLNAAREWLNSARMARFDPSKLHIDSYSVPISTVDQLGLTPDVIKIDVQGFEENVLAGGFQTVCAAKPVMIVEAPTGRFIEIALRAGLSPYRLTGAQLVPGDLGGNNTLFLSNEKRAVIEKWILSRTRADARHKRSDALEAKPS
jgi:FkbM family methyltransferase